MFSRTTDAGETWSTPVAMRNSNSYFQGNQIAVGPDGTLYNVTANLFTGSGNQKDQGSYMGVMRSTDGGLHWSAPVQIAPIRTAQLFVPDDHFPIRAEDYLPDIAIDPKSGAIYSITSRAVARRSRVGRSMSRQSRLPVRWHGWGTERGGGGDLVPCLYKASFITDAILLSMGAFCLRSPVAGRSNSRWGWCRIYVEGEKLAGNADRKPTGYRAGVGEWNPEWHLVAGVF
jgi:hypothetical protein